MAQRVPEIGVRIALGAERTNVLRLVLKQGILLAGVGTVIGLGSALALTELLTSQLYGVSRTDPWTYGVVALFLLTVASLASFVPAYRASRVQAMVALRHE